jgi:serine/threonine protein kinase/Tol biopolymer transport system component
VRTHTHPNLDSERWSLIESLYHSASELAPEARRSFLASSCSGDDALLSDVLSLIDSDEATDSFLEEPAFSLGLRTLRQPREELAGTSIDRYQLISRLGSGGMGDVYLAHDPRLNRRVALKLLNPAVLNDEPSLRRFEQEARAASAISHQNVAYIHELNETDGRQFITMEYVAGPTLRQVLKQGAVDTDGAVDIVTQILSALIAAHRAGVVHRDIKPENIIIAEDNTVKVLDFGLAKVVQPATGEPLADASGSLHTTPELLMGTSHYMSPEQVRRGPIDVRSDLWSVGVVFYELLCERRPFPGRDHNEVMIAVLEKPPLPFSSAKRPVPQALQDLILTALSKSPDDRFQTAAEMLAALKGIERTSDRHRSDPRSVTVPLPLRTPLEVMLDDGATGANRRDQSTTQIALGERRPLSAHRRLSRLHLGLVVALVLAVTGTAAYFFFIRHRARAYQLDFQPVGLAAVINDIALSSEAKSIASVQTAAGKQSIHLFDRATSTDVVIVPATGHNYAGLSFSPDSSYVYYLENQIETATLFRIPKVGGAAQPLVANVNTAVTFSPDGKQIAFVSANSTGNTAELVIAQADGSNPRTIARRDKSSPDRFPADMKGVGPLWSPDGTKIACPVSSKGQPEMMDLDLISIDGNRVERLTHSSWSWIWQASWLADDSGLVIAGSPTSGTPSQIYFLSLPDGKVQQLSHDLNNYTRISAALDSRQLLTLRQDSTSHVWTNAESGGGFSQLTIEQQNQIAEVGASPSGSLVYSVIEGASNHLLLFDIARNTSRPLTFGSVHDWGPAMSTDGKQVVFVSNRSGKTNLWTLALSDIEPHQLTKGANDDMPSFTPDGKSVIYRTVKNVARVAIDGGPPEILLDHQGFAPALSPDGRYLAAFVQNVPGTWELEIIDIGSRQRVSHFTVPATTKPFKGLRWSADGKGLAYVSVTDGIDNIWSQPLEGGSAIQLTSFSDGEIPSFSWGHDTPNPIFCVRTLRTYTPALALLSHR